MNEKESAIRNIESKPFTDEDHALMRAIYGVLKGQTVETGVNVLLNVAIRIVADTSGQLEALKQFCIDMIDVHAAEKGGKENSA